MNTYIHLMQQNQGHVIYGNTHHMKRHDIYVNLFENLKIKYIVSYIKMSVFWLKKDKCGYNGYLSIYIFKAKSFIRFHSDRLAAYFKG